ncbi:MAG: hypothetical protein JOZ86_15200 [Candidatus Eremiobacteraeota bacterium]|nr:hypothetical protein [Candidatus Eremiobacteraeota bacterium]
MLHTAHPPIPVVVRAVVVSGDNQQAHAYAAAGSKAYLTEFPQPLVVRVEGGSADHGTRLVRFRCTTPGCVFPPVDADAEPKSLERHGETLIVTVEKGRAQIRAFVRAPHPAVTYTIVAEPVNDKSERPVAASFTIVSR